MILEYIITIYASNGVNDKDSSMTKRIQDK